MRHRTGSGCHYHSRKDGKIKLVQPRLMRGRIPISVAKIIADQAPHLIFLVFGFAFIGAPFMGVMSQQHHLSNPRIVKKLKTC